MKRLLIISALIACILITGCTSSQTSGKGTLQFSSSPQGAQIYLDKMYQGTTPSTLSGVLAGTHTLEFRDPGYQSWITNITVTTETANYYAALTPVISDCAARPDAGRNSDAATGIYNRIPAHRYDSAEHNGHDNR